MFANSSTVVEGMDTNSSSITGPSTMADDAEVKELKHLVNEQFEEFLKNITELETNIGLEEQADSRPIDFMLVFVIALLIATQWLLVQWRKK